MSLYYRHSGRFSPPRLALLLPLCLAAGALLALAYGYLFAYLPIVGYVSFILAAGFGLGLGVGSGLLLRGAHVRSVPIAVVVTLVVTGFAYYASWIVWVHAIAGRSDVELPMMDLATSPGLLWSMIWGINEHGVMSIRGWTPRGSILTVLWSIELLLIFIPAFLTAIASMRSSMYCESCSKWCEDLPAIDRAESDLDEVGRRMEAGDLSSLTSLPPRDGEAWAWTRVDLKRCPCAQTNAVSVSKVWIKADDEGKHAEETAVVIDRLLLDRATADQVARRE